MNSTTTEPQRSRTRPRIDIGLSKWQYDAVARQDHIRWLFLIGGRGSGKTFIEKARFWRWANLSTELHWGIFGATDTTLNTILAPFLQLLDQVKMEWRFESQAPQEWRDGWVRDGVKFPARRPRSTKLLILRNGAHFVTGSLVNNAYTRFKSFEFNGVYFGEGTEPGVDLDALTTLWGATRCGQATEDPDGTWRCHEPGHLHQLVLGGNEPLNDPSHWIYKKHDELTAQEKQRELDGKKPFYKVIFSSTWDNKRTGEDFVDGLRAALDSETFKSQTAPTLRRNVASLSYHAFSAKNVLQLRTAPGIGHLSYNQRKPLHMWFDFNATPAIAGWGHDLGYDEVPPEELKPGHGHSPSFFGVVGELFSGAEPMGTDAVAHALLEDPARDSNCADCRCPLSDHVVGLGDGFLCKRCAWKNPKTKGYCLGRAIAFDQSRRSFLHTTPNWHGLIAHRAPVYVYGDATGGAIQAGDYDVGGKIKILRNLFGEHLGSRVHFRFKPSNPAVHLRVLAMNRSLRSENGVRGIFFGDWCVEHIADGYEVVPDPKTGKPLKVSISPAARKAGGYWSRTHCFDGLGYMVDWRWPAIKPGGGGFMPMSSESEYAGTPIETDWPRP